MDTGAQVIAEYKTGRYVGTVADTDGRRVLVSVLAVLRHPDQGDLHRPYDPDAAMFHERRACAHTEKVWVPAADVRPFDGPIPDYRESLARAVEAKLEELDRLKRWAERCAGRLETLRGDYGL